MHLRCAPVRLELTDGLLQDYVSNQNYPDEVIYNLANAAAKTLDITVAQVVEAVGYWFIPYVLTTEYGRVLTMVGKSFGECLKNVNAMHGHIRIAHFSQMNMPIIRTVFEVRNVCRLMLITRRLPRYCLTELCLTNIAALQGDRRVKVQYTPGKETRKGLGPLLVGLLYALAEVVFGITEISIAPVKVTPPFKISSFPIAL